MTNSNTTPLPSIYIVEPNPKRIKLTRSPTTCYSNHAAAAATEDETMKDDERDLSDIKRYIAERKEYARVLKQEVEESRREYEANMEYSRRLDERLEKLEKDPFWDYHAKREKLIREYGEYKSMLE